MTPSFANGGGDVGDSCFFNLPPLVEAASSVELFRSPALLLDVPSGDFRSFEETLNWNERSLSSVGAAQKMKALGFSDGQVLQAECNYSDLSTDGSTCLLVYWAQQKNTKTSYMVAVEYFEIGNCEVN